MIEEGQEQQQVRPDAGRVVLRTPGAACAAGTEVEGWIAELRALMWRDAGLLRDADGLRRAQAELDRMTETMPRGMTRRAIEARNLFTVAGVMVESALGREESRGAHYRLDFTGKWDEALHSVMERGRLRFVA
jgi:L-aspartate oxidase